MTQRNKPIAWLEPVCRFHDEECGVEAIQSVMLLGVAAVALLTIQSQWRNIVEFFRRNASLAINWSP